MAKSTDIFVAKESFSTTLDGKDIIVNRGQTRVRAGHPLLKGRESLFEPLNIQYDIETADAKPGVSRGAPTAPAPVDVTPTEPDPEPDPEPVKKSK